jgi:hypothetical protein
VAGSQQQPTSGWKAAGMSDHKWQWRGNSIHYVVSGMFCSRPAVACYPRLRGTLPRAFSNDGIVLTTRGHSQQRAAVVVLTHCRAAAAALY